MCGLCERWDCGIKPTCFASSQSVRSGCVRSRRLHELVYISVCVSRHLEQAWVWNWPQPQDYFPPESWPTHTSANISLCVRLTTKLAFFFALVSDSTLYLQLTFFGTIHLMSTFWLFLYLHSCLIFHFPLLCSSQKLFKQHHKRRKEVQVRPIINVSFSLYVLFQIKTVSARLILCGVEVCPDF